MNFKKWVKSIPTAGYNGARTVYQPVSDMKNLKFKSASIKVKGFINDYDLPGQVE